MVTWRLGRHVNAPCNFSHITFTKLSVFLFGTGFLTASWSFNPPAVCSSISTENTGDSYLGVSPHIHGCWHFEIIIPLRGTNSVRLRVYKTSAGYLPSPINSDLCLSNQNRQTGEKKEEKKSPPASPLTACWRAEGWTYYHGNALFAPHFSRDLAPTSLPSPVRHSTSLSLPCLLCGVWMNIHDLKGIKTMLPTLQHFIVMPKPSTEPTGQ